MNMLAGMNANITPLPFKNDDTNKNLVKLNDLYRKKDRMFLNQKQEHNANLNLIKDKIKNRMKEFGKTPPRSREELKGANKFWIFSTYK